MKKQMLKLTMLLLAIVFGGSSAWAQKVIFERAKASSWTADDATGTEAVADNSNGLFLSCSSAGKEAETISAKKSFEFTSGSKVTLVTEIKMGNDCGNATSYDYFTFGGLTLKVYRKKDPTVDAFKFSVDGGEEQVLPAGTPQSATYKITFVIDQATGVASYALNINDDVKACGSTTTTTALSAVEFGHYFAKAKKSAKVYLKSLRIVEETAPTTVNLTLNTAPDYTYSTYSPEWNLDFSTVNGIEAYKATVSGEKVNLEKVNGKVRAYEGLLIKNVNHVASVSIPTTTEATALEGNNLVGVTAPLSASNFTGKTAYILTSDTEFQLITDASTNKLAKGKAYLELPADAAAKPSSLFFGEATGINGVAVEKKADNAIYNLQGMRVKTPTKGLYIINGKKYRF